MREKLKEINIEKNIMDKIEKGKIKMKPRLYFILGSILTFLGVVSAFIVAVFTIGLLRFLLRAPQGRMAGYRLEYLQSQFPWWVLFIAIVGLAIGIILIRKYDFVYKIKPLYLVLGLVMAAILAGTFLDATGLNDTLYKRGYMRQFIIEKYGENLPIGQGRFSQ